MPNSARASYELKIGESEYVLRPTFEAVMEFQDKTDIGVFEGIACLEGKPDVKVVAAAIWAGIKGEHIFQGTVDKCPSFSQIGAEVMDYGVTKVVFHAFSFLHRASCPNEQKKSLEEYLEKIKELAQKTQTEIQTGGNSQAP